MRKLGIGILTAFILGLIIAGFFLLKSKKVQVADPFVAVPADAVLIIETPDLPELLMKVTEKEGLISRMGEMEWAARLRENANEIDSITGKRAIREFMEGKKVIISFHPVTAGKMAPLAVMNTGPVITRHRLTSLISLSGARPSVVREIGRIKIFKADYGKGNSKASVYFTATSGILIASPSQMLVENALNNKNAGTDIRLQQGFSQLSGAFGNTRDNLFILFRNLPRVLNGVVNTSEINRISGVAVAAGGEVDEKEGGFFISGYMATSGAGSGADRIKDIVPLTPGVQEVLPASTRSFTTLMKEPVIEGVPAEDPSSVTATDIALSLKTYTENEFTLANVETSVGNSDVALFRLNNKTQAEELLMTKITGKYRSMGLGKSNFMAVTKGRDGEDIHIYRMPFTGVASMLAQGQKLSFEDNWALFCRSYLIFAPTPEVLIDILNASLSEKTLINDQSYREVEKSLPTKSSYLFYASSDALSEIGGKILSPEVLKKLRRGSFAGIGALGISLTPSNDMVYTSVSIAFPGKEQVVASSIPDSSAEAIANTLTTNNGVLLWKTTLAASPVSKPFIFINHNNNAKEIFVQDASNNVYLISAAGKVLWKTHIKERIRGEAFMIDIFGNGKNQILFTGKDYIHVIDRNGSYVEKFPVKLKSPASNTLSVVDYESNKDYRLFIAGEDRKIHAYDKSGASVKGWVPFVTSEKVTAPVKYFRTGGKDYLVAYDSKNVYILDRRGGKRVSPRQPVPPSANTCMRLTKGSGIAFAGNDGQVDLLSFSGSIEKKKAGDFSSMTFFDYADINGDGNGDYLFYDNGTLSAFNNDLSMIFATRIVTSQYPNPEVISLGSEIKFISLTDDTQGKVWLFDGRGQAVPGFPVSGTVQPVAVKISASSGYVIVTGGPDNTLSCYKVSK
ncbi:MAG TPA: WD40 repeat domain-containing protein [Bacteroidales bacterium]|nr:WD40 repeat domain-containing protein [Bacteroidales bacterium]